jgi:hypothetical protein
MSKKRIKISEDIFVHNLQIKNKLLKKYVKKFEINIDKSMHICIKLL